MNILFEIDDMRAPTEYDMEEFAYMDPDIELPLTVWRSLYALEAFRLDF